MDIGKEKPAIQVEPLEDPFRREPVPEPERAPVEPVPEPVAP